MKRILFATDYLESSGLAFKYATSFARCFDATLVMLHAFVLPVPALEAELYTGGPSLSRREAEAQLDVLALTARETGVKTEVHMMEGSPSDIILRAVKELAIDFIVLGAHGVHQGIEHLVLGSNVEKVILASPCPVLTVGAHAAPDLDPLLTPTEVLCVLDRRFDWQEPVDLARCFAQALGVPFDICRITPDSANNIDAVDAQTNDIRSIILNYEQEECACRGSRSIREVSSAGKLQEVLSQARQSGSSLIVLGVSPETFLKRHLRRCFAYRLLAEAPCPVISVRSSNEMTG